MVTRKEEQVLSVHEYMRGGAKQVQLNALSSKLPDSVKLYSVLTLVPGASIGVHTHTGETELIYVLDGCGHVHDDGTEYDVCAGDCTVTMSGHSHGIENTGDNDLTILASVVRDV